MADRDRSTLVYVRECVECEGFDCAMVDYSDYPDVEDAEFHRLREEYLKIRSQLAAYLRVDPNC